MNPITQLSAFNAITFVEKTHEYFISDKKAKNPSVTGIIKRFKTPFDVESAARRVSARTGDPLDIVKLGWELNNKTSTSLGSILHKYIENSYGNKKIPIEKDLLSASLGETEKQLILDSLPILITQVKDFLKNTKHIHSVRNELVIGDIDDTEICGMVDLLGYNSETDSYEILDFKTNKKILDKSPYKQFLKDPFNEMSDTEIGQYTIQLNVYQYILSKYTSLNITKRKIVWFNAKNETYKIFELEDIQDKIIQMIEIISQSTKTTIPT